MTELYVEAILADAQAADAVNALWVADLISDDLAAMSWLLIICSGHRTITPEGD